MTEINTNSPRTLNGHEIVSPVEKLDAAGFRARMREEYGFVDGSPLERAHRLKEMSVEGVAILLEDINKSVQGSRDSLMNHDTAPGLSGDVKTLAPENRYEVFLKLIEAIRACPEDTNPARIGDVLALGVVMLHPFRDGNGRTARTVGMLLRDYYDSDEYQYVYDTVTDGRDIVRSMSYEERQAQGRVYIPGYIPYLPEGTDQSDPQVVSDYLHGLLRNEESTYTGTFGDTTLKV